MKVLHVVGARPNFMKTAPIVAEMNRHPAYFQQTIVHTGQHYDRNMSRIFFDDLRLPQPAEFLSVGSGTHAEQTAGVMLAFEPTILKHNPDWVMVVGDVNSTLACSLVCAKLGIPVTHVEAGLRSGDRSMPEEINRLLTDRIADLFFTPSRDASLNLLREGIAAPSIHFVGNVMIDSLVKMLPVARNSSIVKTLGLEPRDYLLATLHRPANVDDPTTLSELLAALEATSRWLPVVVPLHPRTRTRMRQIGFEARNSRMKLIDPLGYLDFLALMCSSKLVLTDSGGIQEETTYLKVPCITVRPNTERPVTVEIGTNRLVDSTREAITACVKRVLSESPVATHLPELWDGSAAKRIVKVMRSLEPQGRLVCATDSFNTERR